MVIRSRWLRYLMLFVFVGCPGVIFAYFGYHQIYRKGIQAEVYLVNSYVHTLEKAFAAENGQYRAFSYYGAPLDGVDACEQPEGAAELGFLIPGCHQAKAAAPRYAFRVIEQDIEKAAYVIESRSGSDAEGRSLVCFEPKGQEFWVSQQNQETLLITSCW